MFLDEDSSPAHSKLNHQLINGLLNWLWRYKAVITSVNAKGKSEDVILDISTQKEPERQLEVKPG